MRDCVIRSGDTFTGIAARYGVSVRALVKANPQLLDADGLVVGERVHIPDTFTPPTKRPPVNLGGAGPSKIYVVKAGDTLSEIGERYGVSYHAIAHANHIPNPDFIRVGQVLEIPARGSVSHPPPTHTPPGHVPPTHKPPAGGGGGTWKPGPGQLLGGDTAHYQDDATFAQSIQGAQWTAIKATEATGYVDPTFARRWAELGKRVDSGQMKLRVAYAFLHPGNGAAQAKHFLDTLNIHGPLPAGTRLAMDWESNALSDPQALHDASQYVHQVTGLWPLTYTSASNEARAKAAVPDAPLWIAKWRSTVPTDVPFVQYNDGPGYDHDVFNGDVSALKRFAGWS